MADGIRLGGAFYEITANSAPLIQAMAQAEARSKASAQQIAAATGIPEKAVARYAAQATQSHQQAARAAQQSAAVQARAALQVNAANQQASASFGLVARGAIGSVAAFAGVASAAVLVHQAMQKVAEQTQKAAQAQFGLQAAFGASAQRLTEFSKVQGAAIGRTPAEIQQAIVLTSTLSKNYGFTNDQIEILIKRTADYAALTGREFLPAVQDVVSAMRGEGDAAERLGLALQKDALKGMANLTAEQKKNFESLSVGEHSRIAYAEFLRQTAEAQGTATKRTQEAVGAAQNLQTAQDNLAVTFGQGINPSVQKATGFWADLIAKMDEYLKKAQEISRQDPRFAPIGADLTQRPDIQVGPDPGVGPPVTGAQLTEGQARARILQDQEELRRQSKRALEAADKANDATAESAIKAIDKERKEKERWYDEERSRIEARRTYQLEDIEARRDAAIAALEEEKRASKEALESQIEDQERLKDARLAAAEQAADAAKATIDAEKDRLDRTREIEDRARSDERELADRALEDARRDEDRVREQAQKDEIRSLEKMRDERVALIEDAIEADKRAAEQRLRAIDREADRARANSDKALARLERQGEKEDEQHRKRMQALEDEQDARLGILDAQLAALDAQERSADAAERAAGIQKRLAEAQREATAARGTGTPAQIAAAQGDLVTASRGGNPISIANARERLVQLAGKGNEAIREADEKLADAQADLAKEGVDNARGAEREKLKAAQAAIRDEIADRKRAEDDEERRRKLSLEREQENERGKLKARLDRLEKQKQATRDNAEDETRALRETLDAEKRTSDERIQTTRDRFDAENAILQDRRREEDRFRDDQREAQDRFRADERTEQDKALAVQLAAVNATLEQERKDTEAHFNGPNGTITQLRKAIEDSELLYSRRLAAVRAAFEAERKAAELKYTNPEGNGELQLLEKQRVAEVQALEDRKTEYEEQAKAHHTMIEAMLADLDEFIRRGSNIPRIGGDVEAQRSPGSGKLTSSSTSSSQSRTSGKQVQGDIISWLNDAMDLTGVPDDWLPGLKGLLDRESFGGDPHAKNPKSTASGLFQLIDSTWAQYRDKNLPNNVFDPVANAVAGIKYIKAAYGSPSKAIQAWESRKPHWYDAGGMITRPSMLVDERTMRPYGRVAERGPEYVIGRRQTAMLGNAPQSNYAAMGAFMAQAHPGGAGGGYVDSSSVNFYGLTYEQAEGRQRQQQHRRSLLKGAGRRR